MSKYHNLKPFRDEGRTYRLRQWLNIVFIVVGFVGMGIYFADMHTTGLYVVGAACVLKFIELTLRLLKM
jgi:hypothetical protein